MSGGGELLQRGRGAGERGMACIPAAQVVKNIPAAQVVKNGL